MKTIILNSEKIASHVPLADIDADTVATIGFFDGVHRGHKWLLQQQDEVSRTHNLKRVVVTFAQHPKTVVLGCDATNQLGTLEQKLAWIEETGVDYTVVLDFDRKIADMSADDFMYFVLKIKLRTKILLTGYDHHFGKGGYDTFEDYCRYGKAIGIQVYQGLPYYDNGKAVSSSLVRREIEVGHMEEVAHYLGRPYIIVGKVVKGEHIGRTLGFPTANISLEETHILLPLNGVYAVEVLIDGFEVIHKGMMNIGSRPTFSGRHQTVEVNLFDYSGDLYGKMLQVSVMKRIRKEQRFANSDELKAQILRDKETIQEYFESEELKMKK